MLCAVLIVLYESVKSVIMTFILSSSCLVMKGVANKDEAEKCRDLAKVYLLCLVLLLLGDVTVHITRLLI